nr:ketosynthase [Xylella fastidiosa]
MFKRTEEPDSVSETSVPTWVLGVTVLLALAYVLLAHWANTTHRSWLAVLAVAALVLMGLVKPIARGRIWARGAALLLLVAIVPLWESRHVLLLLALSPVVSMGWVAWFFGGSLRHGHIPLITRIVEGLHRQAGQNIGPLQYHYGRRLTLLWTVLLTGLTVVNGVLELCAVPSGVLAQLGQQPWLVIPDGSVSVYVNLLDYALIGIFFIGEYVLRGYWFPQRPYRNFVDFLRQMVRLGPEFWRHFLR